MKFSRPDVACNASRFHGPKNLRQSKAKWMEILNEDVDRGFRNTNRSKALKDFSGLAHGTWSHFSYGDPLGSFKTDRALYGDSEARRRHIAKANRSAERWQHPQASQAPLPEAASQLAKASPSAPSAQRPPPSDGGIEALREAPPPSAPRSGPSSSRAEHAFDVEAAAMPPRRESARPPPQLPQLWMSQPRVMTPHTPLTSTSVRSASVTPSSIAGSQIVGGWNAQHLQPPLRRMESDPGMHRGYIDPALKLRPSPGDAPRQKGSAADRYTTTFAFG